MLCSMTSPSDVIPWGPLLDTVGCEVHPFIQSSVTPWSKLVQCFLFQPFNSILCICIWHWSNVIHLLAMCGAFPTGEFSLQPSAVSASCWQNTSCWHFVPCRVQEKGVYIQLIPALLQQPLPTSTYFMEPVATSGECTKRYTWWLQSPFKSGRVFFWWTPTCSNLPLKFPVWFP